MTDEQLIALKKLASRHECAGYAYAFITSVKESPYYEGYITLKSTIDKWNQELQDSRIRLTSDKDDKAFDRTHKYFNEINVFYDKLEYFRSKLTPDQIDKANAVVRDIFERALQEADSEDEQENSH